MRFRLRGTGVTSDLRLRATGVTTADAAFEGEGSIPRSSRGKAPERWLIYPARVLELRLPKTVEQNDEGGFAGWQSTPLLPVYVYRLPRGLYHGQHGAVVDHQRRLLGDVLDTGPDQFSKFPPGDLLRAKTEPHFCSGDAVALSSSQNYFLWLIKFLPRLHLVERAGVEIANCDALFINQPLAPQLQGYLAAGLRPEALRIVKRRHFWCCRSLFVTTVGGHDVPPWAIEYLRRTFASLMPAPLLRPRSKAIYLSRRTAPRRRVLNEEAVCEYLATLGVEAIELSERPLAEQVEIVAQADLIIAPHGAALSNLVFAKSNARVLEIFSDAGTLKCFWILSHQLGITYHYFVAEKVPRADDSDTFDMMIPIEKLKRALDFLLRDDGVA